MAAIASRILAAAPPSFALARGGRFAEVLDLLFPVLIHRNRQNDVVLGRLVRLIADDIGPEAFIRQQQAIMGRPDSRPTCRHRLPDAGPGRRRR